MSEFMTISYDKERWYTA